MFVGTESVGTWQRQSHDRSEIVLERRIEDAGAKKSAGDSLEKFDVSPRKILLEYKEGLKSVGALDGTWHSGSGTEDLFDCTCLATFGY
jgi:hypothetical protein